MTQNVDDLRERADSKNLLHMHGELLKIFCTSCREVFAWAKDLNTNHACAKCSAKQSLRPDIVWFEEMPYHMDEIYHQLRSCDVFVAIGTSGNVYPAAGFDELFVGEASKKVREFVNQFYELATII